MTDRDSALRVIPPEKDRSFSFRRAFRVSAILLGSLIAIHAAWGCLAERRLDARLREYRAAGEWVDAADFLGPAVPPDQNAAFDLRAAGHVLEPYDPVFVKADNLYPFIPLTPDEDTLLRAAVDKFQIVFDRVESAARKPAARWEKDYSIARVDFRLPEVGGSLAVASLLYRDALLAHTDGDDRRALRRIENLLDVAHIQDAEPIDVAHTVAGNIAASAAFTTEQIAPDLRIGDAPGAATTAAIRRVIHRLLDDDAPRRAMVRAMWGTRRDCWVSTRTFLAKGTFFERFGGYTCRPLLIADAELTTRMATAEIRAFEKSLTWPAFRDGVDLDRSFPEARHFSRLSWWAVQHSGDKVKGHYMCAADRHLAATVLALRCYAADHAGQLPATLDALVPTYLPAVPTDPMSAGGTPLCYRPSGDDPNVYSVGDDGRDDAGSGSVRPEVQNPTDPPGRWERLDVVAHLRRQPRPHWPPFGSFFPSLPRTETPTP